jgi:cysteine desulfurase
MQLPDGTLYLDFNATTPLTQEVAEALDRASRQVFGNPSSNHAPGREAKALLEGGRAAVSRLVGCAPSEVVLTSSGTEAAHLAWETALAGNLRKKVIISSIEHPCVSAQAERWAGRGFEVLEIPVDGRGVLDLQALESALSEEVALVSVMAAHNETGVLQPVAEAGRLARAQGALFHTDAVQALGKVPSPWSEARPDFLSLSAHKFYGPKGAGALAAREGLRVVPMLVGGGQEGGARSSTEAVPSVHATGVAADRARARLGESRRIEALRDSMEAELRSRWGALVHGAGASRLPNTSFFSFPSADGSALATALDARGIFVATGSACHGGGSGLPRALTAMGVPAGTRTPLRVSLGVGTRADDVGRFLGVLGEMLGA